MYNIIIFVVQILRGVRMRIRQHVLLTLILCMRRKVVVYI